VTQEDLEQQLDDFDPQARRAALQQLTAMPGHPVSLNVNMHLHSFFSFNAEDYSPSRLAWEAKKAGLYAAGLCDFDVLDGLEEFLEAGRMLGLRATVNLETRAFFKEYAEVDISSPGEPGVTYIMGAGFARLPAEGSAAAGGLAGYRDRAGQRNVELVNRLNPHLGKVAIDYETDVLPLSPAGTPTERHIIRAYVNKARHALADADAVVSFWSETLGLEFEETVVLLVDPPALEDKVRSKLVKRGGVGYAQPSESSFPPVDAFVDWVASCGAIPMVTWLDGTSGGEQDGRAMLECMQAKGAAAINIIPDRNWNIADPAERQVKQQNLGDIVAAAEDMGLPVNVGTEMNKRGLPFVDDLDGEVLSRYREVFLRGARIMVGHTVLLRYADYSYIGDAAKTDYPDVKQRNAFFEAVGGLPAVTVEEGKKLEALGAEGALAELKRRVRDE
jgi:hypothetical protein